MPSLQDFLAWEAPEGSWVLPGLLTTGRTLLFGRPKAGKSFLSAQIAESLSLGEPLMDSWTPTRAWRTLYVSLDVPSATFQDQLRTMGARGAYVISVWDVKKGPGSAWDWLDRFPLDGTGPDAFRRLLAKHTPDYVILDGLTYLTRGLDDREGPQVKILYDRLRKVWAGPHLILSHANKTGAAGDARHPIERVKGATELTADADSYIFVESHEGQCEWHVGGRLLKEETWPMRREPNGRWARRAIKGKTGPAFTLD